MEGAIKGGPFSPRTSGLHSPAMSQAQLPSGRSIRAAILDLSSPKGALRLAAVTELIQAGAGQMPEILATMRGEERELMRTPWGEALLQIIYAQHWDQHRDILQEAYFQGECRVHRNHLEMRVSDSLGFLTMCLSAPTWQVREDAAHALLGIGPDAKEALPALRSAAEAEENEDAKLTMQQAMRRIEGETQGL
jgi:hypothetical protein